LEVHLPDRPLGAEVHGIDIAAGIDDETFARLRALLDERSVIVIRNQRITPAQQVEFCGRFGTFEPHVFPRYLVAGHPELICISNILDEAGEPIGVTDAGRVWHTDGHFDERPNLYSMLYSIEVPRDDSGRALGATWFVSTAEAYERLDEDLRRQLEGRTANNSLAAVIEAIRKQNPALKRPPLTDERQIKGVTHPAIRTHPRTGRKCVYVAAAATRSIDGLPHEEGRALIERVHAICTADDMVYKHQWDTGDLLIWDNCATQHLAIGDYALPQRRLMHRATIAGSVPI
jgi:taurine dioxygenase